MKAPDYLKRAVREERGTYVQDSELLSVLLSVDTETGQNLLAGHSFKELNKYNGEQLQAMLGITEHQASVLSAALMLGRRSITYPEINRKQISCPADAAAIMIPLLEELDQEELWVLTLNTKNWVTGKHQIYRGTANSSHVRAAEVLKPAVMINAPSVILAHNHPSGDTTPSPEDVAVTRDLVAAGKLFDIMVYDHIVIGGRHYMSMKERSLGF